MELMLIWALWGSWETCSPYLLYFPICLQYRKIVHKHTRNTSCLTFQHFEEFTSCHTDNAKHVQHEHRRILYSVATFVCFELDRKHGSGKAPILWMLKEVVYVVTILISSLNNAVKQQVNSAWLSYEAINLYISPLLLNIFLGKFHNWKVCFLLLVALA
jgi:hypothetical protein